MFVIENLKKLKDLFFFSYLIKKITEFSLIRSPTMIGFDFVSRMFYMILFIYLFIYLFSRLYNVSTFSCARLTMI
jgi:flagellar biogenesis protein FliO